MLLPPYKLLWKSFKVTDPFSFLSILLSLLYLSLTSLHSLPPSLSSSSYPFILPPLLSPSPPLFLLPLPTPSSSPLSSSFYLFLPTLPPSTPSSLPSFLQSYLQEELELLLNNNKQMETLTRRNNQLEEENKSLKELNSRLTADIERLKTELAKHTDSESTEGHGGVS